MDRFCIQATTSQISVRTISWVCRLVRLLPVCYQSLIIFRTFKPRLSTRTRFSERSSTALRAVHQANLPSGLPRLVVSFSFSDLKRASGTTPTTTALRATSRAHRQQEAPRPCTGRRSGRQKTSRKIDSTYIHLDAHTCAWLRDSVIAILAR